MASPSPTNIDPHELDRLRTFWSGFIGYSKIVLYAVIALLVLLAIFLLPR